MQYDSKLAVKLPAALEKTLKSDYNRTQSLGAESMLWAERDPEASPPGGGGVKE